MMMMVMMMMLIVMLLMRMLRMMMLRMMRSRRMMLRMMRLRLMMMRMLMVRMMMLRRMRVTMTMMVMMMIMIMMMIMMMMTMMMMMLMMMMTTVTITMTMTMTMMMMMMKMKWWNDEMMMIMMMMTTMTMTMTMTMMMMMTMTMNMMMMSRRRRRMISIGTEPRTTLCASLCSRNARQHFTRFHFFTEIYRKNVASPKTRRRLCARATLYANLQEKCRAPVETHVKISQEVETHIKISKEPLNLQEKGRTPEWAQNANTRFCASLQSKCTPTFHKSHFIRKFTGKMHRPKTAAQTLCKPAQSKRMSRFHKSHFYGNLQEKARDQSDYPDQAPAFAPTVRTPHCGHTVWGKMPMLTTSFIRIRMILFIVHLGQKVGIFAVLHDFRVV